MARITVEDCLERVDNRFQLIHLAAKRVRELKKGAAPLVVCKNKDIVVALREIAAGKVIRTEKGLSSGRIEAPTADDLLLAPGEEAFNEEMAEASGQGMTAREKDGDIPDSETDESEEAVKEK
ncbi:MAG: DNA-directed RNA polymerase subunit omega [Deltaproteobacteria bacterium]|nr:DNA-directed RNA polymerase subunit omega [Deltaproteobacteria bacterium]OQX65768.1 MAG: DNA-directed RNA polymerase subunit omega [Desulfococcus sp. 4484_242]